MKKENRIKKNHEIASIVNGRKKVASKNYVIYYRKNNEAITRVAFSVSKKLGHSFERNKSKRIARNIFRKHLNIMNMFDLVVVIKPCSKDVNFEILENEINFLLKLILKKQGEKNEK